MKNKALKALKKLDTVPNVGVTYQATKLTKKSLDTTKKMVKFLRKIFDKNTFNLREEAVVVIFGSELIPIGYFSMSKGNKSSVSADFHYLFQMLILLGAEGFIYSHNHPLQNIKPSEEDVKFTYTLQRKSEDMDFRFYDHIILNDKKFYSFEEEGYILD